MSFQKIEISAWIAYPFFSRERHVNFLHSLSANKTFKPISYLCQSELPSGRSDIFSVIIAVTFKFQLTYFEFVEKFLRSIPMFMQNSYARIIINPLADKFHPFRQYSFL